MNLATTIAIAALTILVAGLLGGCVNCLQARQADEPLPKNKGYYLLLSVAAASSVPLFLSLTKSELLKNVLAASNMHIEDWFILFAVCVVAAIFAQTFLESVSKNLLQRVQTIEEKSAQASQDAKTANENAGEAIQTLEATEIKDEQAEAPDALQMAAERAVVQIDASGYPEDEQKILNALLNSKSVRRSIAGISKDSGLSRQQVRRTLGSLIAKGAVHEVTGQKTGALFYQLKLAPS
jgi:hypothetical protein